MNKIKKILACIDFSEYSLMTLEYALEIAQSRKIPVIVFNVINLRDLNGVEIFSKYFSGKINVEDHVRELRKDRYGMMEKMIKEIFFDEKSLMKIKIDTGIPFECILKAIETENIDLVVMANKGRGNISSVLFGSTAEKVFRHSPVPVVNVRDREKFKSAN